MLGPATTAAVSKCLGALQVQQWGGGGAYMTCLSSEDKKGKEDPI